MRPRRATMSTSPPRARARWRRIGQPLSREAPAGEGLGGPAALLGGLRGSLGELERAGVGALAWDTEPLGDFGGGARGR